MLTYLKRLIGLWKKTANATITTERSVSLAMHEDTFWPHEEIHP